MKHKLTVLACLGLALLLSTGFAFAQNVITVESKNVNRCTNVAVGINLSNADGVDAIGLPLVISGGGSIVSAAPTARLSSHTTAVNQQGANILLNAVGACLAPGNGNIWTLTVSTPSDCSGAIEIDTAFFAPVPVASLLLTGCDCCELPVTFNQGVLTLQNQAPVCGSNSNETLHFSGAIVNKQLNASDPDVCDALTFAKVSGPGTVSSDGKFNWDPQCADVGVHTVIFSVSDGCTGGTVNCQFTVTVTQNAPVCQGVSDQSVHWADVLSVGLPATDDGCPNPLTWSVISVVPPVAGPLSVAGGTLNYDPTCSDIAGSPHVLTYQVSDGVKADTCSVGITVTNTAPTVQCPTPDDAGILCRAQLINDDGIFNVGDLIEGDAIGDDADADPLTYSVSASQPVTNAPTIDASGHFSWQSSGLDAPGIYEFCIEVSDGCATDECCFTVELEAVFYVGIGDATGTVDTIPALPGTVACVYVHIDPDIPLGGFDLLFSYDLSALSFQSVSRLNDLAEWEYWTYRLSANSNCTGGCPSGLIRVVAIADLDNGPANHPPADAFGLEGNVLELCFLVTSDWNFLGQCLPIDFIVLTCGDNTLASKDGNTTYLPFGSDPDCLIGGGPGKPVPVEQIQFCGGWICVREPQDARGDINLNGVANEISDAVLFSNYFIQGSSVWTPPYEAVQEQATDVNNDGVTLTVADLVYLIRIITGDAQPFPDDAGNPKVSPYAGEANAFVKVGSDAITVSTNASVDLGGAMLVFRYSDMTVGEAASTEASKDMVVRSRADRGELRVLVAPPMDASGARISAGNNEIVTIPVSGEGSIELVSVELADANGSMLVSNLAKLEVPKSYALMQNYPNPFNAGTVIRFDLKEASDWTLTVYNITGQVVRTFSGHDEASSVSVLWDGKDNKTADAASGVYFYRVNAGNFTATKKMTLLK
ncbi:MAG: T9SS type A sorting domain-containing protein [Candidatus Zixiibacteriota bacterium]